MIAICKYVQPAYALFQRGGFATSQVMAAAGVASRRACEELIEQGAVKVNGEVVQQQGTTVDPDKDKIEVNGKRIAVNQQQLYYFAVNKPKGYICSNADTERGKRAVDLMQPWLEEWSKKNTAKVCHAPCIVNAVGVYSTSMIHAFMQARHAQQ